MPQQPVQRLICVKDISDKIRSCCVALNSLCVSDHEAQSNSAAPAVASLRVQPLQLLQRFEDEGFGEVGEDETDGSNLARFRFLQKHYRTRRKNEPQMCEVGLQWLQYLKHNHASPLWFFRDLNLLSHDKMLLTLLRVLLYRLALVQESHVQHSTEDANTLIMLYLQAASTVEHMAGKEVGADMGQFLLAVDAYYLALQQQRLKSSKIRDLVDKVKQGNASYVKDNN